MDDPGVVREPRAVHQPRPADIACGSTDTCAAFTVDQNGVSVLNVYGGTGARWTSVAGPGSDTLSDLSGIACARTLCAAVDRRGGAIVGN